MIFWPIRPQKLFRNRHINTIIINRSQSIEHILEKNFIIMRVSVKFFSNFIAIITRLKLYGKNRGNSNSSHSSVKICISSKTCDEKLFFLYLDGRAGATELSLRKFLQRAYWSPISRTILSSRFCAISTGNNWIISQKIHERRSLHSRALKLHKKQHFSIFSPFWKFWKISTRWDKYIWIEEYNLSNNFFEKFAKI